MTLPAGDGQGYRLGVEGADRLIGALAQRYRVMAPVRRAGRGRFSDCDHVRYGEVVDWQSVEWQRKSDCSPKTVVFPISETTWHFVGDQAMVPGFDARPTLVLLRACDINGYSRLDQMFLHNGGQADPYYARRRATVRFALLECPTPFANCFCVSMGANRTDDWDLALRPAIDHVLVTVRDRSLLEHAGCASVLATAGATRHEPVFVTEDAAPVRLPNTARLTQAIRDEHLFDHPFWQDYDRRCIACGRCNTSCVTCTCFTTDDVASDDNPTVGERRRTWAGCHIDRFTDMAGGHRFREGNGARMRFKTMHKIHDFRLRFGHDSPQESPPSVADLRDTAPRGHSPQESPPSVADLRDTAPRGHSPQESPPSVADLRDTAPRGHMCVGCGRCDDQCPQYISFSTCINRLHDLLGGKVGA